VIGTSGARQRITSGCAGDAELTETTTQIAGRSRARQHIWCALSNQEAVPGRGQSLSISWAFLNVAVSRSDSGFPNGEGPDVWPWPNIRSLIRPWVQASFIVFVIFMLKVPYFLLGIASQRNLRYNVPNR
jgi:hypothetical protein